MLRRDHGERIRVLGLVPKDRLEQAYAEADVLVMPSLYEGFGMPSIEAMRYGVPVVATAVGGLAEVVPPDAGVLVSPGSSAALAAGIMEMTDPARRWAAGAKGREWARHYEWPRLVAGLVERYEHAVRRSWDE
jgi:glycosyltransferase involved in cell wall biosynthesis